MKRLLNFLIAVDQLAHVVITLGKAHPDETISSALWRLEQQGHCIGRIFRPVVDFLFRPWGKDHCRLAFESEQRCSFCNRR